MAKTQEEWQEQAQLAQELGDVDAELEAREAIDSLGEKIPVGSAGYTGAVEPVITMATGLGATAVGGVAGVLAEVSHQLGLTETDSADVVKSIQSGGTYQPRSELGKQALKFMGEAINMPAAGIEGLRKAVFTDDDPVTAIEDIKKRGIGHYVGESVAESTGSPALGAAVATIPTAIMEGAGGALAIKSARQNAARADDARAQQFEQEKADVVSELPTDSGVADVVSAIKKGDSGDVQLAVNPDPNFYAAMDRLDISTEPLASFASQNPQYRGVEMGLSAIPESTLAAQSKAFIAELTQKADDLITRYGGEKDKAFLSTKFKEDSQKAIDDIYDAEGVIYDAIRDAIPADTRTPATNTVGLIDEIIKNQGGVDKLSAPLRDLYRKLKSTEKTSTVAPAKNDVVLGFQPAKKETTVTNPTYDLINAQKKLIGQQLGRKGNTPFKNEEIGQLKQLYSVLKSDLDAAAARPELDVGELVQQGNVKTQQRKQMEDNLSKLLGSNLEKDLMTVMKQRVKGLKGGELTKWKDTLNKIDDPVMRQKAVVSALNDLFRGTRKDTEALDVTQFTKTMNELNRQPTLKKALWDELPEGAGKALDDLSIVSKGVSQALEGQIPTGITQRFNDSNIGFLRKLIGRGSGAIAAQATGGVSGMMLGNAVNDLINKTTNQSYAAAELLAMPEFQKMIKLSVRDGVLEGNTTSAKLQRMQDKFDKSEKYKKWKGQLPEAESIKLMAVGLIPYLFGQGEE